jgi:ATP-dependent DNA helicase RecQ
VLPLRPFQSEALEALGPPGAQVIVVAPTGSGKSRVYEEAIQAHRARAVLVTPLIALARQQRERLEEAGIAAALACGPGPERGPPETGAWILSPERLELARWREELQDWDPDLWVIDECHCVWDWGERFRPAFSRVPELIARYPRARGLWLTATLPPPARRAIRRALPGADWREVGAFRLPPGLRLEYRHAPWPVRLEELHAWLLARGRARGIVFSPTRESCERIARGLAGAGIEAVAYHAGLAHEERRALESRIASAQHAPRVVSATSAFGMGVHLPHLEWVALWQSPPSPLSLAQSLGRAGRSAAGGDALVLWAEEDFHLLEWMVEGSSRRSRDLAETRALLEATVCRQVTLQRYFDPELPTERCLRCDRCTELFLN